MISFYPGPSQTVAELKTFLAEAADSGILTVNHRSSTFTDLYGQMVSLLREKLDIPSSYRIMTASSATECWEIIGQSFISLVSFHAFNGAFGQKWYEYRTKLSPNTLAYAFPIHRMLGIHAIEPLARQSSVICLTQNETSNGTQLKNRLLKKIRTRFQDAIICVDATSSMAGIRLDWLSADIWFASVQKCFGLPAGLAVLICSPRAIQKAQELLHQQHYNSLVAMAKMAEVRQTTHTPNVLNIFLLKKVMETREPIDKIAHKIKHRADKLYGSLIKMKYECLVADKRLRSDTVIAVKDKTERIAFLKKEALQHGFLLGNGYGKWKDNTLRIANFPAISDENMEALLRFFNIYSSYSNL